MFYLYYILHYSLQNYICGHVYQDFIITTHYYLYFRTVHVVIFILFKPTHALFFKTLYYITQGSQPNIPQISTSGTHTHGQHTATYQINNLTMQTSREVVTALSTKDDPLKLVKQL